MDIGPFFCAFSLSGSWQFMWQNNIEFLDVLTMISFILQVQNSEGCKLDEVNKKLDVLIAEVVKLNARVG